MSLAINYPDYFPCCTWRYGHQLLAFQERTEFSSGWNRQRRKWPEAGIIFDLSFQTSTVGFASWSAWMWANGHNWFRIKLDDYDNDGIGDYYEVRLIGDAAFTYATWDTVDITVQAELKPAQTASSPPVPVPPIAGPGPIPPTDIYCLEYECDAYDVYLSGTGEYYWPGYNPVSDGYLEGTVNLPANGNFTNGGALFPDACVGDDGWISAENAYLDGAEIFEHFSTVGEYSFSTLYKFFSGTTDDSVFIHTLGWRYGSSGIAIEVLFTGYLNGSLQVRIDFYFGADSVPLNLLIPDVIPNDGIPHVIGFSVGLPGETVPAGSTVPIPVRIQVDGLEVGTGEATGDFYNAGGPWVFAPDFPGLNNRLWYMAGSTNNYFSNMAMNGGLDDLDALRNAYLQNFIEYNDPDPDCVPRPTATYEIPE